MPAHDRSVLIVSHDSSLRETYALLFNDDGYPTQSTELQDLPSTLLTGDNVGMVVMDHTLSQEERKAIVQIIQQLARDVHTVILHSSGKDCGADLSMDSREGAARILEAVKNLVNSESPETQTAGLTLRGEEA
jgi:DNA-binding NtrC family response regulator